MKKILLGLIGLLFAIPAVAATLPAGYTELTYVNMPAGSYLQTDIVPTYNGHYELEFAPITLPSTGGILMGGRSASYPAGLNLAWSTGNTPTIVIDGFSTNRYTGTYAWVMGTKYKYTWNNKVASISTGGSTVVENTFTGTNTNGGKLYINALNNQGAILGNSATINVYSFSAWDSAGTMVGNFIPAKNASGVIGMYDTVSGTFFTNAGTGEFTGGPVVPENPIKIATTAYNAARFSPVVTELNDTIATIRSVVTNTINQTKAIADLQATKQTRPNETCPAGKKCLLVEDDAGQPHWYEIIENAYGLPNGYTGLEYIEANGSQYIVLSSFPTASNIDITTDVLHTDGTNEQIFLAPASGIQPLYTTGDMWRVWASGKSGYPLVSANTRHVLKVTTTPTICEFYVDNQKMTNAPNNFFTSAVFSGATFNLGARTVASGGDYYWKGRIYSFYAECDSEECMNLVPAKRNSDNAIGMYDLDDTNPATAFHTNAGSGTFVAGPEI